MPQLGETVTEGTITRWIKSVGDTVERDEPLFEVSTDKVDSEVPSPASGVLSEILVPEGDTVEVGVRLAVIAESAGAPAPESTATPAEPAAAAPQPEPPPPPPPTPPQASQPEPPSPTAEPAETPAPARDARILSPVVRRLLADNQIDPSEVKGTGLGGRITREDVLAAIDRRRQAARAGDAAAAPPPPPPTAPPPPSRPATPSAAVVPASAAPGTRSGSDTVVPFSNMRRRTAEHMVRSKSTSPHAFIAVETDFEAVEKVRRAEGPRFAEEEGFSLTYLPFVARSVVESLRDYPNLNASVVEDSLVVHAQVNLGIAVDLQHEGLIVPVVHRAEEVTLRGVARRIRDLADRARARQLTTDDISGGTFSITNDGPFGTYFTVPIINQPQVAILATDGIKRRPVVVTHADGSESIAIHSTGVLGMSWDHRAVDGAYVSAFLARVSEHLTTRDWTAEL